MLIAGLPKPLRTQAEISMERRDLASKLSDRCLLIVGQLRYRTKVMSLSHLS